VRPRFNRELVELGPDGGGEIVVAPSEKTVEGPVWRSQTPGQTAQQEFVDEVLGIGKAVWDPARGASCETLEGGETKLGDSRRVPDGIQL
jgi:hypothetical protein